MDLKSPITQKTVHKTGEGARKKSWEEIVAWIIGIITGLVAIYEFIIKGLRELKTFGDNLDFVWWVLPFRIN